MTTCLLCVPLAAAGQMLQADSASTSASTLTSLSKIDAQVNSTMAMTHSKGMALAVVDHGKVVYLHAFGIRNAEGDPLTTNTVMYGASLTKTVFAYTVMQLVDQGRLNLDTPLKDDLDKPLPAYGPVCRKTS